jgi:hypothetical protein
MALYLTYGQPYPDFSVRRGQAVRLAVPGIVPVRKSVISFFSADAGQNHVDRPQQ